MALVAFLARARGGLRGGRWRCSRRACGPSVLDFLDGETLALAAAPIRPPGWLGGADAEAGRRPGRRLRADRRARRQRGGGGRTAARGSSSCSASWRCEIHEPFEQQALWRWRDGINPARHGRARREGERGRRRAGRAAREGARALRARSPRSHGLRSCSWGHAGEGNVHATVLVDPARERGAGRGRGGDGGAVRAGRGERRLDRRRARRRAAEAGAARAPVERRGRSSCTNASSGRSTRRGC